MDNGNLNLVGEAFIRIMEDKKSYITKPAITTKKIKSQVFNRQTTQLQHFRGLHLEYIAIFLILFIFYQTLMTYESLRARK